MQVPRSSTRSGVRHYWEQAKVFFLSGKGLNRQAASSCLSRPDKLFYCRNFGLRPEESSERAHLVNTGNTREAVPLVAAALSPPRYPMSAMFFFLMGTEVDASSRHPGLIASVKCSGVHIALLSFHRVCPRGRLGLRKRAKMTLTPSGGRYF